MGLPTASLVGLGFVFGLGSGTSARAVLVRATVAGTTRADVFAGTTEERRALLRVEWVVPALFAFRGELLRGGGASCALPVWKSSSGIVGRAILSSGLSVGYGSACRGGIGVGTRSIPSRVDSELVNEEGGSVKLDPEEDESSGSCV